VLYTDGSLLKSDVGCAFICKNNEESKYVNLKDKAEVVNGEIVVIREVFKYALTKCRQNRLLKKIYIFSDSQSSIQKLRKTNAFSEQKNVIEINEYVEKLHDLNIKCVVEWLSSHSNIEYNEKID
jgi:ribonuclease HI